METAQARLLLDQGRLTEAVERCTVALTLDPRNATALLCRARAQRELGQFEKARRHLDRAMDLQPQAALVHGALGYCLLRQGLLDEAEESIRECIKRSQELVTGHVFLAMLHATRKDRAQTLSELHTAIRLGRKETDYIQMHDCFDFLKEEPEYQALMGAR